MEEIERKNSNITTITIDENVQKASSPPTIEQNINDTETMNLGESIRNSQLATQKQVNLEGVQIQKNAQDQEQLEGVLFKENPYRTKSEFDIREDTVFKGEELKVRDELITEVIDEFTGLDDELVREYNQKLNDYIDLHSSSKREATVAAAIFLATQIPKIPYFWGGGHELTGEQLKGINKTWGIMKEVTEKGDDKYTQGSYWPYSLDCSSFVSWCMINGGLELEESNNTTIFQEQSKDGIHSIKEEGIIDKVHVGDFVSGAQGQEHVGIIVDVDRKNNRITVAHVSGSGEGINLTTMEIGPEGGIIVNDEIGTTGNNRVGEAYFENILLWDYEDE